MFSEETVNSLGKLTGSSEFFKSSEMRALALKGIPSPLFEIAASSAKAEPVIANSMTGNRSAALKRRFIDNSPWNILY
ncbi:hypothetical protein D3C73_1536670 [compost metagenome]